MLPYPWDHTPLCLAHGAAMNSTTKWKTVNVCTHTLSSSSSFAYTGKQVVYVDKCQRTMNLAVCQFQLHFKVHRKIDVVISHMPACVRPPGLRNTETLRGRKNL